MFEAFVTGCLFDVPENADCDPLLRAGFSAFSSALLDAVLSVGSCKDCGILGRETSEKSKPLLWHPAKTNMAPIHKQRIKE